VATLTGITLLHVPCLNVFGEINFVIPRISLKFFDHPPESVRFSAPLCVFWSTDFGFTTVLPAFERASGSLVNLEHTWGICSPSPLFAFLAIDHPSEMILLPSLVFGNALFSPPSPQVSHFTLRLSTPLILICSLLSPSF